MNIFLEGAENTDELLSRLLKKHEMRIMAKLLTENFVGDDTDPEGRGYSPSQNLLGNVLDQKRVNIVT